LPNKKYLLLLLIPLLAGTVFAARKPQWTGRLEGRLKEIDREFPGDIGVYVKNLEDGRESRFASGEPWYFASTVKVFVGACLLREAELGRLKLSERVRLRRSDFVDGSGEVKRKRPGQYLTLHYLFEKMLTQRDSTATDMLIRRIGIERFNAFVREQDPDAGPITTIVDVRRGAYAEAIDGAQKLSNLDFIALKSSPPSRRLKALARRLGRREADLRVSSLEEAFERFYGRGYNSGSLEGFGKFIERLAAGRVLSAEDTAFMLKTMRAATTGTRRIQAGLPPGFVFAQKTGTQVGRMCNVGMISRKGGGGEVIVAACIRGVKSSAEGEAVFRKIGRAMADAGLWRI
jgi:beta-lactamase class A